MDEAELTKAFSDTEYIIHNAGLTKAKRIEQYREENVAPLAPILNAALKNRSLKKLCYVSSLAGVGPGNSMEPLTELAPLKPISPYGASKAEAENFLKPYQSQLPIVIIRPPAVYGPRDTDFFTVVKTVKSGLAADVGSYEKHISIVYVEDLARAIITATLSGSTTGKAYFVTDGFVYSTDQLNEIIAGILNKKLLKIRVPAWLFYIIAAISQTMAIFSPKPPILNLNRAKDFIQAYWICSSAALERDTGFKADYPLKEGMKKTIDWYREQKWL
jgi:nucleoside-diphosphate-sugar epimerase